MLPCFFVSDLHGHLPRYEKLFWLTCKEKPVAIFLGGDLLPSGINANYSNSSLIEGFIEGYLEAEFVKIKNKMGNTYPRVFLIMGNDDPLSFEDDIVAGEAKGLWEYIHGRCVQFQNHSIYGYAFVPPTPFLLKDWERYDVSRYVDPGCISPEEGWHSKPFEVNRVRYATIYNDLKELTGKADLSKAVFLFHAPPYQTTIDRACTEGISVDHVPLDVNIGSIAIKRFIKEREPLITLHGHVHEAAQLTGSWQDKIGRTQVVSAAHKGEELALVRFDLTHPEKATRELF